MLVFWPPRRVSARAYNHIYALTDRDGHVGARTRVVLARSGVCRVACPDLVSCHTAWWCGRGVARPIEVSRPRGSCVWERGRRAHAAALATG